MPLVLLLAFFLFALPLWGTEIKFNYLPAENNLDIFPAKELSLLLPRIRGVKDFSCKGSVCEVELYPLLVEVDLKGFSPFIRAKVERYLGLKTYYRYSEKTLASTANTVAFYLKNNGFLDVAVKSVLHIDRRGFARLEITASEGRFYLWGGFNFNGTPCFSPSEFYRAFGKPFGIPFSYFDLYTAVDLAGELCSKRGYTGTFVYYRQPFEVRRKPLSHFLWENLKENPFWAIDFLSRYADLFLQNPFKGIYYLFHPLYAVYPDIYIRAEGKPFEVVLKGVKGDLKKRLGEVISNLLRREGFLSTLAVQRALLEYLRAEGYFDAKVEIKVLGKRIEVKISTGRRYRVKVKFIPPLKGFDLKPPPFYTSEFEKKLAEEVKNFLRRKRLLYRSVSVNRIILRDQGVVLITVSVKGLRRVKISTRWDIEISDTALGNLVEETLRREDPYTLVLERERLKLLERKILNLLKDYGCARPRVKLSVAEGGGKILLAGLVRCGGILRFGPTAFWVEGRLHRREIEYLLPDFRGKRFKRKLIDMLQNRLALSKLFESYTVKVVRDGRAIPLVEAVERKPLSVEGQVGYSSDEGPLVDLRFTLTDPFGYGSRFSLGYRFSAKRKLYTLSYLDNYFFSKRLFVGGVLFKKYEEHRDYTATFKGYSLTFGYHLNLYTDVSLGFISDIFQLSSELPVPENGSLKKLSLNFELYYPLYSGLVKRGVAEAFGHLSAGRADKDYWKFRLGGRLALSGESLYLSLGASFGCVSSNAPIFEKFYLGGLKNLKGYTFESVAPVGGGDLYWYAGAEMGIPLKKPLYGFFGFDVGNAVRRGVNPFADAKADLFAGVGSVTAVGPLRFVVALPLKGKVKPSSLKYLFLVGFNF